MNRKPSAAQLAQRKHWQLTGQLSILSGLANYILSDPKLDPYVKHQISIVRTHARQALFKELKNNQFINPESSEGESQ